MSICLFFIAHRRLKKKQPSYNNTTLVNIYTPTRDKADSQKETFYEQLQLVIDQIPKIDTTVVLGDANAKLGKEDMKSVGNIPYMNLQIETERCF